MPVELRNAQRGIRVDGRRLKRSAEKLLGCLDRSESVLSILLTNDRQVARIHKRWMGQPGPTDVLSFPMDERDAPFVKRRGHSFKECPQMERPLLWGDIAISVETAARRAGGGLFDEMIRLLIHGMLHLAGHDHARKKDRQRMDRQARRLWRVAKERG